MGMSRKQRAHAKRAAKLGTAAFAAACKLRAVEAPRIKRNELLANVQVRSGARDLSRSAL